MYRESIDQETKTEQFNGIYRGVVENNNDPKQAGRIQIRVMPMFAHVDKAALPWAVYADPFGGGSADVGGLFLPEEKSNVFCFFENGDHRYPVYFAGAPSMQSKTPDLPKETRDTTYPKNRVIKTKSGITIELDDTKDKVRFQITHPSGTTETIDNKGKFSTLIVNDDDLTIKGDYNIKVSGNANIKVDGNLDSTVSGDTTVSTSGNTKIESSNNTDVTASGLVNIKGALVNINGS